MTIPTIHLVTPGCNAACGRGGRNPSLTSQTRLVDCSLCERTTAYAEARAAEQKRDRENAAACAAKPLTQALAQVLGITPMQATQLSVGEISDEDFDRANAIAQREKYRDKVERVLAKFGHEGVDNAPGEARVHFRSEKHANRFEDVARRQLDAEHYDVSGSQQGPDAYTITISW